jgi:hypothetical protein
MNRSIEIRLKRLEDASTPVTSPRRSHVIGLEAGQDREAREAAKAELIASGAADLDDFFFGFFCHWNRTQRAPSLTQKWQKRIRESATASKRELRSGEASCS